MPQSQSSNNAAQGNNQLPAGRAYPNGNPDLGYNLPGTKNTDSAVQPQPRPPVTHIYDSDGPAPGSISFRWTYGSNVAAKNNDPRVQVMQYNEDSFIMRQNVCVHWEAPFTYLLFGNDGALLIDTGATANPAHYPLRETVEAIIARWAKARGRTKVPLTIALTSGEDIAQNQGLGQFAGRPNTRFVPAPLAAMKDHYGMLDSWPNGTGSIDLGDRVITVIPTPGAHKDGVSFYDPYCDFLLTGDLLFPGKINIGNDKDFLSSLERLKAFADANPVKWVMGGHVEMMFVPGKYYPRFATYKPYERVLEMEPSVIDEAITSAREIQGQETLMLRADFVLLNGVSPDARRRDWPADLPNIRPPRPF